MSIVFPVESFECKTTKSVIIVKCICGVHLELNTPLPDRFMCQKCKDILTVSHSTATVLQTVHSPQSKAAQKLLADDKPSTLDTVHVLFATSYILHSLDLDDKLRIISLRFMLTPEEVQRLVLLVSRFVTLNQRQE